MLAVNTEQQEGIQGISTEGQPKSMLTTMGTKEEINQLSGSITESTADFIADLEHNLMNYTRRIMHQPVEVYENITLTVPTEMGAEQVGLYTLTAIMLLAAGRSYSCIVLAF